MNERPIRLISRSAAPPAPAPLPTAPSAIVCSACGDNVDASPEATSVRTYGAYALVAEWRICACGAFVRSERVKRLETDDDCRTVSK